MGSSPVSKLSSFLTSRCRASRTCARACARSFEAPSSTAPSGPIDLPRRTSSSLGGGSTRSAAVRGAPPESRFRSPAVTRAAASATVRSESANPSSALPGTASSSSVGPMSATGSARMLSSCSSKAASSATCASAARMVAASVAGVRLCTRAAPRGPAACAATRASAAGNSSVSRTEAREAIPPTPRGRSG